MFKFLIGVKVTLLKPELWLNRSQQLCRTCSPRPAKLWPTAGLQRQLFTWKERLSKHSAGSTIPPWMTAVWVSPPTILPDFPISISPSHSFQCPFWYDIVVMYSLLARLLEGNVFYVYNEAGWRLSLYKGGNAYIKAAALA